MLATRPPGPFWLFGISSLIWRPETAFTERQRAYANYAPGTDAWYDTAMLAYTTPKSWSFPFQLDALAEASAVLEEVWGLAGIQPVGGRSAAEIVHRLSQRAEAASAPRLSAAQADLILPAARADADVALEQA